MWAHGHKVQGRYQVERLLGEGGMARVFLATHAELGTRVVLKVLHVSNKQVRARMLREARLQANLRSPHIVEVIDCFEEEGEAIVVMRFAEGGNLATLLDEALAEGRQGLTKDAWIEAGLGTLEGLAVAHAEGVIHRDLKPDNLLLGRTRQGQPWLVQIADFGIAKAADEVFGAVPGTKPTRMGVAMGTPAFMAPEQTRDASQVTAAADVFAVGATLYALAVGSSPFDAPDHIDAMTRVRDHVPRPLFERRPDLPEALCATIDRALNKDPSARYPSASIMLDAWRQALPAEVLLRRGALVVTGRTLPPSGPTAVPMSNTFDPDALLDPPPTAPPQRQAAPPAPSPQAPAAAPPPRPAPKVALGSETAAAIQASRSGSDKRVLALLALALLFLGVGAMAAVGALTGVGMPPPSPEDADPPTVDSPPTPEGEPADDTTPADDDATQPPPPPPATEQTAAATAPPQRKDASATASPKPQATQDAVAVVQPEPEPEPEPEPATDPQAERTERLRAWSATPPGSLASNLVSTPGLAATAVRDLSTRQSDETAQALAAKVYRQLATEMNAQIGVGKDLISAVASQGQLDAFVKIAKQGQGADYKVPIRRQIAEHAPSHVKQPASKAHCSTLAAYVDLLGRAPIPDDYPWIRSACSSCESLTGGTVGKCGALP